MLGPDTSSDIATKVSLDRNAIYWEHFLSPEQVASAVHQYGIAVFPSMLSQESINRLNLEFDNLIAQHRSGSGQFPTDTEDQMINVRVMRPDLNTTEYPDTADLFGQSYMSDVSNAFFGDDQFRLNGEIFVTELGEGPEVLSKPPFALHFDKRQVLKFYFYLTDSDETNGAMRASPGSHNIIQELRVSAARQGELDSIDNVMSDDLVPSIPISGPAGTMLVFTTDVAHGAGRVSAGQVRRTMRGHTHSYAMLAAMGIPTPSR